MLDIDLFVANEDAHHGITLRRGWLPVTTHQCMIGQSYFSG